MARLYKLLALALILVFVANSRVEAQNPGIFIRNGTGSIADPVQWQTYVLDYSGAFPQMRVWNGSGYSDMTPPLGNFIATTDPTVNDDDSAGYAIGSQWVNTSSGTIYLCVDATTGAAQWNSLSTPATVTSVSVGNLSPLFTTNVASATTTPTVTFTLSDFAAHKFYGNPTGSTGAPSAASITAADLPSTTVNSVGNLSPLFTAGISAQALSFTASAASAGTIFGNFTSGSALPGFNMPGAAYTFPAVTAAGGIDWTALAAGAKILLTPSAGQIEIATTGAAASGANADITSANSMTSASSLVTVGALASGSIASGFGGISTTNPITTTGNISTTGSGAISSSTTVTATTNLVGAGLSIGSGTLATKITFGSVALVAGTATISDASITANSVIQVTEVGATPTTTFSVTKAAASGFTITDATAGSGTETVMWTRFEP